MRAFVRVLSIIVLLATCGIGSAQPVFVPDTNLRAWFNAQASGCVDALGWFDPSHPGIQDTIYGLLINWPNSDLTGLEALPNVRQLAIGALDVMVQPSISVWPDSLRRLRLEYMGGLEQVTGLPPALRFLDIDGGSLISIGPLPASLEGFSLASVPLVNFPALPPGLRDLWVRDLPLMTALPSLPNGLRLLKVFNCPLLIGFPTLPNELSSFWMHQVPGLNTWPAWPDSLRDLQLFYVSLSGAMPPVPDDLAEIALIDIPGLTAIQSLGANTRVFDVGVCPLLEVLPDTIPARLNSFSVWNCPLVYCLPWLHDTMNVYVGGTGITCLPNLPTTAFLIDPDVLRVRPCAVFDPSCAANAVSGIAYEDLDLDGQLDPGEPPFPNATIRVDPGASMVGADSTGFFRFDPGTGNHVLSSAPHPYVSSVLPASHTANLLAPGDMDSLNHFGHVLTPSMQDLRVHLAGPTPRSGLPVPMWAAVHNAGTVAVIATLTLTLDTVDQLVSSTPAPTTINGATLTWELGSIPAGMWRSVDLVLEVLGSTPFGTSVLRTAQVDPTVGDQTPLDNQAIFLSSTLNSYDPNDKQVEPAVVSPAELQFDPWFTYRFRFQNCGNAEALRVVITDTLDHRLDRSTVQVLASSHTMTWSCTGDVLSFIHDDIHLPDSASDPIRSQGFVLFRMKVIPGLSIGDSISNRANIFFDLNPPVITEPAILRVDVQTGLPVIGSGDVQLYPNPAEDVVTVVCGARRSWSDWSVVDAQGRTVLTGSVDGPVFQVPLDRCAPGIQAIRLTGPEGSRTVRFTKR